MGAVEALVERNAEFAEFQFDPGLRMRPSLGTIVICCADTRVDPAVVLGAAQGEIMAIRNVGGRVTPRTIEELFMLRNVATSAGDDFAGWELIVMQHTQCGITRIGNRPDLLSPYFEAAENELDAMAVGDPRAAVARDVEFLRAEPRLAGARTAGLVYDVMSGLVEILIKP